MTHWISYFKNTFSEWTKDNVPRLCAALSYYTVLSLAPMVVLAVAVAGLIFGREAAQGQIVWQFQDLIGKQGAEAVQSMLKSAAEPKTGMIASGLGILMLLFGASGVFTELRSSLDEIWEVEPKKVNGLVAEMRTRIFSFAMVLSVGFLLMVSLVLSAGIEATSKFLGNALSVPTPLLSALNLFGSLVLFTFVFAMIYRVIPEVDIAWGDVWVGGAATALLFTLGKFLIGLYLGKASVGSAYGAAGSLVVVLVWIYYSAQIFYFGAEFTKVYARRSGSHREQIPKGARVTPFTPRLVPGRS